MRISHRFDGRGHDGPARHSRSFGEASSRPRGACAVRQLQRGCVVSADVAARPEPHHSTSRGTPGHKAVRARHAERLADRSREGIRPCGGAAAGRNIAAGAEGASTRRRDAWSAHHCLPHVDFASGVAGGVGRFSQAAPENVHPYPGGIASNVQDDVRSGLADFGIGYAVGLHGSMAVDLVTDKSCYVVMPSGHRLRASPVIRMKDISDEPMISMPTNSGLRRTIDIAANAQGVALNHSIVTNQFGSLFDFVANGLGISIVPATALPGSSEYRIVARKLRPALTRQIGILRLPERPLSSAAVAFLNVFRPKFLAATARPLGKTQKR